VLFLIIFTKNCLKGKVFVTYQNNFQGGWVLQVDLRIYQENHIVYQKFIVTQRINRQLNAGSVTALICGLGQTYVKQSQSTSFRSDKKRLKKEHYTGCLEFSSLYWNQQSVKK
jgi:hypothetical protein